MSKREREGSSGGKDEADAGFPLSSIRLHERAAGYPYDSSRG